MVGRQGFVALEGFGLNTRQSRWGERDGGYPRLRPDPGNQWLGPIPGSQGICLLLLPGLARDALRGIRPQGICRPLSHDPDRKGDRKSVV